ncbi:MAG TPA: HEAT repeat domain-containing protein, partial [Blastocatellia bacterium]|nr:HEAT repeat domain-containing protein [Blastocatellia bacterium]
MRLLRPTAISAAFLIVAVSTPPSMFSQTAPRRRQPNRPQRADALAPAINELLKLDPLNPILLSEKDSENADARPEEKKKPPADDAPIKELTDYWAEDGLPTDAKPSDKVRRRLLEAIEDRPELFYRLSYFLPNTTDTYDRLYKLFVESSPDDHELAVYIRYWLQSNSEYFRDELIAEARREAAGERLPAYQLRKLAEIDWEAARPVVEPLASSGSAQGTPLALSLLYERAQQEGDSSQVEKYRALLKAIVVNRQVPLEARHFALASLAGTDWDGQQDWIVSLFADPSLTDLTEDVGSKDASDKKSEKDELELYPEGSTKVLSALLGRNSEKWVPVISNLVGHNLRAVHQSAVRCLADYIYGTGDREQKKEVARKLAPWLTDIDWAGAAGRSGFIRSLVFMEEPELTPGLIWVLEHDEDEENRAAAAEALSNQPDPRAVPALRRTLEMYKDERRREIIVTALALSGGFSDDEMAEAIEAYAKMVVTQAGDQEIVQAMKGESEASLSLKISVGRILNNSDKIHATEELAIRLIERAKSLRASQPAAARLILRRIEDEPLRAAEISLVERIGAGWMDLDALRLALVNRRSLRKSAGDELYRLIEQGGYAAGVAAAILNDEREQRETLAGTDAKAQLALLAGAHYLRGKLPVELAGELLNSTNRALAKAAESYLEVEDSAEARKLVLSRRRGEAYILGDITPLTNNSYLKSPRKWEE